MLVFVLRYAITNRVCFFVSTDERRGTPRLSAKKGGLMQSLV
jgi:hypothetical protein